MAGPWTAERFPQFEAAIRRLTDQHRELVDEPLHLAVSYLPTLRDQQHIFLFEVIGSPEESISPERELFEVIFESTPGFPMGPNEQLHLILTNPRELEIALREGWSLVNEVVSAIRAGDYRVLYKDEVGDRVLDQLEVEARRREAARG
jgi:mRNA-degrading endonuclease RelE of RelBE toxin-antitoxin system